MRSSTVSLVARRVRKFYSQTLFALLGAKYLQDGFSLRKNACLYRLSKLSTFFGCIERKSLVARELICFLQTSGKLILVKCCVQQA